MINIIKKRILPVVVCFAIMLSAFAYRPQKVEAVALTSTAVIASVAAIMTACGVTYWANTQQDAISYLGGQIDDYLDTLSYTEMTYDEWLGISEYTSLFAVIGNGILSFGSSVANKILEFVRWFNQEKSVVSNGQAVGEKGGAISGIYLKHGYGTVNGTETFSYNGDTITCNFNSRSGAKTQIYIPISSIGTSNLYVICTSLNLSNALQMEAGLVPGLDYTAGSLKTVGVGTSWTYNYQSNYNYIYLGLSPLSCTGTVTFRITGSSLSNPDKVLITPSASVVVPNALSVGQTLDVQTNAPVDDSDDVDDAVPALLDTITGVNGLSGSNEVAGEAVPSESIWLWNAITSLPETIVQKIGGLFIPSEEFADTFAETAYGIFDNHFSILSYPFSLIGEFSTRLLTLGNPDPIFRWSNLNDPFSGKLVIAAGQYNLNDALTNQRISDLYDLYMLLVKAIISFQFVNFLYAWFCDVFKMKESDYPLPWDSADGDDDAPDDGDGYDGTWSSW